MSDYENGIEEAKSETLKSPARISKGPAPSDTITSEDSLEHKVSLRMEIMLKKEKLRLEEEANYTYKPKLYTSQKNKPQTPTAAAEPVAAEDGTGRENRFDKLYSDALKRHITQNLKEDQKDKDLTFTPKITKRASSASRSGSNSRSSSRERGGPSDGASDGRQTPRSRKSLEPEKPSFQPVITKRAKSIERARDKEVSDRLYENGLHVKEKMERKRVEAEQKELETCTFAPKVDTRRASSASRLNVVDRMSRFEEVRQRKLQNALEQKKETERSYSFQPTLMSKRPATPTQQPFYERLATPHEKPVSHAAMEALSNLTFQPQIVSKRTPSPNTTRHSLGDYKTVHERLYREGEERRREVENELQSKRHELDSELTFHPQIITPTPQHPDPVFERLSVGADRNEVKQKLDRIKAELTKDWTFQPQISEVSKKLLGPRRETDVSLYERQVAEQRRLEEDNIRKKQDKEREQLKEATFAPKLPESSKELAKKKLSTSNMDLNATGGLDVYSRLASAQSPTGTLQENSASSLNNVTTHNPIQPNINSRSIILPEKVLSQVFERLATPSVQQFEEYTRDAEGKKIVLPEKEKEQVFNRLVEKKTTSFTLKTQGIESRITSHPNSATSKNAFSEEAFLQKIEEERNQPPPASPGKTLAHKDSHLSAVSSITAGTATKETPVKKTRSASASKATSATTTPARQTTRPAATSTAKKSAVKPGAANLPSPPVVRREKISNASPMPPAPPATAVKANQATTQADYYDDLSKKLEASLSLINQTNGVAPPAAPATAEKHHKNSKATTTPNAKKYAITDSPLPKDQEDYINSIPLVADPTNGELSD